ncbi:MAG: nucleotidyl transferase AbiEii/AbiGii toxin family protein [Lachnospiraceae bacterium]|nr:nucleotidyl transferase AbiEii/AbiGii toxin family protein [Lachnospiraceae bacterium]
MLKQENFEMNHINALRLNSSSDPAILERAVYAFGLLESLVRVKMPFIFKGGTCLMLLLEKPRRLSTDIDIIVEPGVDISHYIQEAAKIFPFKEVEEQTRIGKNQIEKRHFKFYYDSPVKKKQFYILLDVLFEENHYNTLVKKKIVNEILLTEEPYNLVTVPSIDCILGDKLTAFAPHTTGIPFDVNKEMEIIKQFFDVAALIEECDNFQDIYESYMKTVESEIAYRGNGSSAEEALQDTIRTASCIISRGNNQPEEYQKLMGGIKSIRTHIYRENYSGEIAAIQACSVIYMAACILKKHKFSRIDKPEEYIKDSIGKSKYKSLAYIKRLKLEAYGYLVEAVKLLEE